MSSPTPASKTRSTRASTSTSSSKENREPNWSEMQMKSALPSPPPSRGRESVFSKRITKANPLMNRNADEGREARRKLFLKRVREGSEEKKWRDRNSGLVEGEDEVLRAIWLAEERRREDARRIEESVLGVGIGEEEEEIVGEGDLRADEVMADEVAMKEEQELEALLGSLNQEDEMEVLLWEDQASAKRTRNQRAQETPYGSDDEEYDHIFMDVIEEENRTASQQHQQMPGYLDTDHEMMDMS